jgi:hypothetical protein
MSTEKPQYDAINDGSEASGELSSDQSAPKAPPADASRDRNGRFRKGHSGNTNGRPKKLDMPWSHRQGDFGAVAEGNRLIKVVENGKVEFIPARQLLIRQTVVKGIKGDLKSAKAALEIIDRAQSSREWRERELYKEIERLEELYDEMVGIGGEPRAKEIMSEFYNKTRKR